MRREKSIVKELITSRYSASSSGSDLVPFTEIWLPNILIRNLKKQLADFVKSLSDIHTVKTQTKTFILTARWEFVIFVSFFFLQIVIQFFKLKYIFD